MSSTTSCSRIWTRRSTPSFAVGQRAREVAIRVALGGPRGRIAGLLLRQSIVSTAIAVAIGLAMVAMATSVLERWLVGVSPVDFLTFAVSAGGALAASAAACYLPIRQMMRMDTVAVLRGE